MPLSINKLKEYLASKGFIPVRFFVLDDLIFYIEVLSSQNAGTFFIYIPSKYEFGVKKGEDNYKIRYVDMEGGDNTADEYAGGSVSVESIYRGDDINLSPDNGKIEEHLENNYRRPISLDDISSEDSVELRSIYRQMRRLRYCVQDIKYKVAIINKNYICAIRRDDSIDCFVIKHYPRRNHKKLMIVADLEMFYEKYEKMDSDIHTVRTGIYNILQRNQSLHSRMISKLLENKEELISFAPKTTEKKNLYDINEKKLEKMLNTMNIAERKTIATIYELEETRLDSGKQGMQNDIEIAHRKSQLETELNKINSIKEDIMKYISILRQRKENSVLSIDKIMFDNTVMFNCMVNNFSQLRNFC